MIKQFFQFAVLSLLLGLGLTGANAAPIDPANEVKIIASDGVKDGLFGHAVSMDGKRIAVGAYGDNFFQGKVYIYDFDGSNWNESAILTADDGSSFDFFGRDLSLSGDRVVVGARQATVGTNSYQGKAYVFELNGGTWRQTAKLTADDGAAFDEFGYAVSLDNDRVVVSTYRANPNGSGQNYQGAAYVFEFSGGTWMQTAKLTASDGVGDAEFGKSVSLDGDRIAVGASWQSVGSDLGQVYVFDLNGSTWDETAKLTVANAYLFGSSVSLDGDRLAVGEKWAKIGTNDKQGAAYIFDLSGNTWTESAKLISSGGVTEGYFGMAISLDGDRVAVGAYNEQVIGNSDYNRGAAYVFELSGGTWNETKFLASDGVIRDEYGSGVAVVGDVLAVGSHWADIDNKGDQGAVYIYGQPAPTTSEVAVTVSGISGTSGPSGTLVLQNNGGDDLIVTADGSFTFATPMAVGDTYNITVKSSPDGQTCTVTNGSGTVSANGTINVQIVCNTTPPATYDIEVEVNGLSKALLERRSLNLNAKQGVSPQAKALGSELVLQNNGGDDLTITKDGSYTFATPVPKGSRFNVTVKTLPNKVNCTLTGGSGVAGVNTGGIAISCKALKTAAQRIPSLGNTALALLMLAFAAAAWFIHRRRLAVR